MPSPFPGVDPYIESIGLWQGFHHLVLTSYLEILNERLPEAYVALVEGEMRLVHEPGGETGRPRPDVAITRDPAGRRGGGRGSEGVAILEPAANSLVKGLIDKVRETWIEVRKLPDLSLVAVIELLSPTNKVGRGRVEYLEKRDEYIERPVHIIEIDLLIAGHQLPMHHRLAPGGLHAIVSRAERRPGSDVYSWTIRNPLPAIPIPLSAPDPDIFLELGPPYARAYDRGRFRQLLRYREPLELPLAAEDRAWAEDRARSVLAS